jgi:phosphoribosylformimino-5-aminoimidazole carboxamide ribotide isomerase
MDWDLIRHLATHSPIPVTYAGGCADIRDLEKLQTESAGNIDATIGSALDIFGGQEVKLADCLAFNRRFRSGLASRPLPVDRNLD